MEAIQVRHRTFNTAMRRRSKSKPLSYLINNTITDFEDKRVLDYGCGRGIDADYLNADRYDPWWYPELPTGTYDIILCTYVLNVLEDDQIKECLDNLSELLKDNGTAYITVRRDDKNFSHKYKQRMIYLDLPIVKELKGQFTIYKLKKGEK